MSGVLAVSSPDQDRQKVDTPFETLIEFLKNFLKKKNKFNTSQQRTTKA